MVLAVTIAVGEDAVGPVRLESAIAEIYGDIADILGHPSVQGGSLIAAPVDVLGDFIG